MLASYVSVNRKGNNEESNDESAVNILLRWRVNAGWQDAPRTHAGLAVAVQVAEQFADGLSAAGAGPPLKPRIETRPVFAFAELNMGTMLY